LDSAPAVRVPAERRQNVAESAGKQYNLPMDCPFNIHVKQSSQNPGANGTARGAADAVASGSAAATAEASAGGSATGNFQIGQAIDYAGTVPVAVNVDLRFQLEHELSALPAVNETSATLSLVAYVRDSVGHVYPKIDLGALSSDDAPGKGSRADQRTFQFVMHPGLGYQVVLHGIASTATAANGQATAKIKLDQIKMNLTLAEPPATQPAAAK